MIAHTPLCVRCVFVCVCVCCVLIQSTAIQELASGLAELDSDMADITQGSLADSLLGGEEDWGSDAFSSRLGGLATGPVPSEQEPVSASSQIASSLGINPHTLQVQPAGVTRRGGTQGGTQPSRWEFECSVRCQCLERLYFLGNFNKGIQSI